MHYDANLSIESIIKDILYIFSSIGHISLHYDVFLCRIENKLFLKLSENIE